MSRENTIDSLYDPTTITSIYFDFKRGVDVSRGKFETIAHLLTAEEIDAYQKDHQTTPPNYDELARRKLALYEPIMDKLSRIRDQVATVVMERKPTEVVDLAAGFAMVASRLPGVRYHAVDSAKLNKDMSEDFLHGLVAGGVLTEADYTIANLNQGFPESLGKPKPNENRVALSIWGASYLRAPQFVNLVRSSFKSGCSAFINIGVNPEYFHVPTILDAMVENGRTLPPSPEIDAIIKLAEADGAGRKFMEMFGNSLIANTPLRNEKETRFYLDQAGKISERGFFDSTSGKSFYHVVVPRS